MFSKLTALKFGWNQLKENPFVYVAISLAAFFYWSVPFYVVRYVFQVNELFGTFLLFFFVFLAILVFMGYLKVSLNVFDGKPVNLKDLFIHYERLPDFLIGLFFYLAMVGAGLTLFVLPGLFLAVKFSFMFFYILQGKTSPLSAMRKSWKLADGTFFNLLLFYLLSVLLNVVGVVALVVGVGVSLPVTFFGAVYVYRKISYGKEKSKLKEMIAGV